MLLTVDLLIAGHWLVPRGPLLVDVFSTTALRRLPFNLDLDLLHLRFDPLLYTRLLLAHLSWFACFWEALRQSWSGIYDCRLYWVLLGSDVCVWLLLGGLRGGSVLVKGTYAFIFWDLRSWGGFIHCKISQLLLNGHLDTSCGTDSGHSRCRCDGSRNRRNVVDSGIILAA